VYTILIRTHEIYPLNRLLDTQYYIVNCRHNIVQQTSRTYSWCITEMF
jgi:hypothetical protein